MYGVYTSTYTANMNVDSVVCSESGVFSMHYRTMTIRYIHVQLGIADSRVDI